VPISLHIFSNDLKRTNVYIIRDQTDLQVRQPITPISWGKQESSSLSPLGRMELKRMLSDEQKDEVKERLVETRVEMHEKEYWFHFRIMRENQEEEDKVKQNTLDMKMRTPKFWKNQYEAWREFEKVAEHSEGTHGSRTSTGTLNADKKLRGVERKIFEQFGKDSELFKYTQVLREKEFCALNRALHRDYKCLFETLTAEV